MSRIVLPVPYFTQVSPVHCQATVLKMYAQYLDQTKFPNSTASNVEAPKIWSDINVPGNPDKRRVQSGQNAHKNIQQWLEDRYTPLLLKWNYLNGPDDAFRLVVRSIGRGYPVLAGVSHARVAGHIVLIVGYESDSAASTLTGASPLQPYGTSPDLAPFSARQSQSRLDLGPGASSQADKSDGAHFVVVHDPYGAFHPSLHSNLYGNRRFEGGSSLASGGERGAGTGVLLNIKDVSRQAQDPHHQGYGQFNLLAPL